MEPPGLRHDEQGPLDVGMIGHAWRRYPSPSGTPSGRGPGVWTFWSDAEGVVEGSQGCACQQIEGARRTGTPGALPPKECHPEGVADPSIHRLDNGTRVSLGPERGTQRFTCRLRNVRMPAARAAWSTLSLRARASRRGAAQSTLPKASALGNQSHNSEPRSGDISSEPISTKRRCRRSAALPLTITFPNADALGYVDLRRSAAPWSLDVMSWYLEHFT